VTTSSPRRLVESPRGATEMAPMEMTMASRQPTAEALTAQAKVTLQRACVQRPRLQAATRLRQFQVDAQRAHQHQRAVKSLVLSQPVLSHRPQAAQDPVKAAAACVQTQPASGLARRSSNPLGLVIQIGRAVRIAPADRIEQALQIHQPFRIVQSDRAEPMVAADSRQSRRMAVTFLRSAPERSVMPKAAQKLLVGAREWETRQCFRLSMTPQERTASTRERSIAA
jgi:hypothetical protein